MSNKTEAPKEGASPEAAKDAAAPAAGGGGIKAFLPLIIAVVAMPALAWVTTQFIIVPKVLQAREVPEAHEEESHEAKAGEKGGHGAKEPEAKEHGKEPKKEAKEHGAKGGKGRKQTYQVSKLIVNVAGSMGTRYLMTSATLVGSKADFKDVIEENKDQLLDLAISVLSTKTINDLEKPGSRNQIRSELISVFNNALGSGLVQEIFFTEFAIQ